MKKALLFLILINTYIFANINTIASILPEKTFIEAIGGEKVNVTLMVEPGSSPHSYEPKPSQMKEISEADLYFSIGVEFEKVWLSKFTNLNDKMKVIDLSKGIQKQQMQGHTHHEEDHGEHEHHEDEESNV